MPKAAITQYIDVAQVVLYAFWVFFFGLIYYLRREDRREGYPNEFDLSGRVEGMGFGLIPKAKTFLLPNGRGAVLSPNLVRDKREIKAERTAKFPGAPLRPTGDPMVDAIGPASYAERQDLPELTREGLPMIVPMRVATDYSVDRADTDPRGLEVVAGDGKVAGKVSDVWVDRADVMVRYLEVRLAGDAGTRLVPITMLRIKKKHVEVKSIFAAHFPKVPTLASADQVTSLEEDKIQAFYAGGRLYAEPKRLGPLV